MISIIIPTLNEAFVIGKTVNHLKSCKNHKIEVIISDGNSKDGTIEIAKRLADQVVVYEGVQRQTIAMARNSGAKVAHGDFLVFMDADVYIPDIDNFFTKILKNFENREMSAVCVEIKVQKEFETFSDRIIFSILAFTIYLQNNFFKFGGAPGEFQMIRSTAFALSGGYREDLVAGEDYEFFHRLSKKFGQTRFDYSLKVFHPGRRAHQIGWPRLLFQWWTNGIYIMLFGKSYSKVWKEIR